MTRGDTLWAAWQGFKGIFRRLDIEPSGWYSVGMDKTVKKKNPHAVALGRKGGQVKSVAKARAARENAQWRQRIPRDTA
jgi:hypothetical protein